MIWLLALACGWGLAEATVFFVVPDVIISWIALRHGARAGLTACLAAAAGAVAGGAAVWLWGQSDIAGARAVFDLLPAIGPATIARAQAEMAGEGRFAAMLAGAMTGVPYKLYAAEAGAVSAPLWWLMAVTPAARLPRFIVAALGASLVRHWLRGVAMRWLLLGWAFFWIVFYALFWSGQPG